MVDPFRLLSRNFLLVALKVYTNGSQSARDELRKWLAEDETMLFICAEMVGLPLHELKEKVAKQMYEIDKPEEVWSSLK